MSFKDASELSDFVSENQLPVRLFWDRRPGRFVHKICGYPIPDAKFTGTIREWYETLVETIIDAQHKSKIGDTFNISVSPDVATILECTVLYKPRLDIPMSEIHIGSLAHRMEVYKNPHQARNVILLFSNDRKKFAEVHIIAMDIL